MCEGIDSDLKEARMEGVVESLPYLKHKNNLQQEITAHIREAKHLKHRSVPSIRLIKHNLHGSN